jgi:25S rRNA (uracil2843-N3)-methyltransferase
LNDCLNIPTTTAITATPTPAATPIIDYASASLITLLFTISELFLQSRLKTVAMLNHITASTSPSTLLLIVESAALSDIPLGTTGKTYSLGTMLDYTLCDDKSRTQLAGWEKIRVITFYSSYVPLNPD